MNARTARSALLAALLFLPLTAAAAQEAAKGAAPKSEAARDEAIAKLAETTSVTKHSVRIGGQAISYTATAGTLPIVDDGKVRAHMFYVYYTRDGVQDRTRRPLVISFNGGPGSSSVWMHVGYTGPRLAAYDDEGFAVRPPAGLQDNEHSILDAADIVYIDPIATGYSRMAPGEDPHRYHGVLEDIESVGEFIRLFVTRNERWGSPKILIGESYGTARAAGLAGHLQARHRMFLNGVILVSMTGLDVERGPNTALALYLPHYTATAWYHKRLPAELQARPLRQLLDEAERFAMGEYLLALEKGHNLPAAEKAEVVRKMARYTGLAPQYIEAANLRVDVGRFRKELMRDRRTTVGRLDSRYTGTDRDAAGESYEYDPAMADWNGGFTSAINRYFREELGYRTDLEYNIFGDVRPWRPSPRTSVGEMLRSAMTENPYLKVLVQAGYYDGGTNYFGAVYTMSQLQPGGELRDRIRFAFYESGHMMYLRKADLPRAKQDIVDFIRWSLEEAKVQPKVVAGGGA